MKEIKAIIQPFMLDRVLDALHEIEGLPAASVSETRVIYREGGCYEQILKNKIEVMVSVEQVAVVVQVIQSSAYTGRMEDGRVFVIPTESSASIRTGGATHFSL